LSGENDDEIAMQAIDKTIQFFHDMGMHTKLSEYTNDYEHTAEKITARFESRGWKGLGERQNVTPERVKNIVTTSY
jgi:NADP-dependent alcohol dehydrogenase